MATFTYVQSIAPKSKRDEILLTIWKGALNGFPAVSLDGYIPLYNQHIAFLATSGYIRHEGDGKWSMTKVGQARLESGYKKLPSNASFSIGEVE